MIEMRAAAAIYSNPGRALTCQALLDFGRDYLVQGAREEFEIVHDRSGVHHRRHALTAVLNRPADLLHLHAELAEVRSQARLREHEHDVYVLAQRQLDDAQVQPDWDIRKARLLFVPEAIIRYAFNITLFAL